MENVSRAALKLHVSQPALSRQVRDLEDELGFSLLERTAKSVRLTDAGRAFLDNSGSAPKKLRQTNSSLLALNQSRTREC
jgi:DNA-binding transcriptional LysR family regulator